MAHVRGHYRRDGSYVRPHYRRSRRSTAGRVPTRPRAAPPVATTHVRGHYRDGSYVRAHERRISPRQATVGGTGAVLLLLLLLVLL
ncbi:hypothetical protein [Streptomyces sp. NPDC057702]|uniref:hypothetical protein n=1 Tax=unclassified Streptomyces TaxID=2593676 RepID=UPI00368FE240